MAVPVTVSALPTGGAEDEHHDARHLGTRFLEQRSADWDELEMQARLLADAATVLREALEGLPSRLQATVKQSIKLATTAAERTSADASALTARLRPQFAQLRDAVARAGAREAGAVAELAAAAGRLGEGLAAMDSALRAESQAARSALFAWRAAHDGEGEAAVAACTQLLDVVDLRRRGDLAQPAAPPLPASCSTLDARVDLLRRLRRMHEAVSAGSGDLDASVLALLADGGDGDGDGHDAVAKARGQLLLSCAFELLAVSHDDSLSLSMLRALCRERRVPCAAELAALAEELDPARSGFVDEAALLGSALHRAHGSPANAVVRVTAALETELSGFEALCGGQDVDADVRAAAAALRRASADARRAAGALHGGSDDSEPALVACVAALDEFWRAAGVGAAREAAARTLALAQHAQLLLSVNLGLVDTRTTADDYDALLRGLQQLQAVQQSDVADKLAALFDARRVLSGPAAEFWVRHFGSQAYQVLFDRFWAAFEQDFGPQLKNDQRLMRALVVDRAGVVNVYSLQRFARGLPVDERFRDAVATQGGRDTNFVHIRKRTEQLVQRQALHERKQAVRAARAARTGTAPGGPFARPLTGVEPLTLSPGGGRATTAPLVNSPLSAPGAGAGALGAGALGAGAAGGGFGAESEDALYGVSVEHVPTSPGGSPPVQIAPIADWRKGIDALQPPRLPPQGAATL